VLGPTVVVLVLGTAVGMGSVVLDPVDGDGCGAGCSVDGEGWAGTVAASCGVGDSKLPGVFVMAGLTNAGPGLVKAL